MLTMTQPKSNSLPFNRALLPTRLTASQLIITLSNAGKMRTRLADFERFLKVWNLKIVNCRQNKKANTLELTINTHQQAEVRWASNLAHDFFRSEVSSITSTGQAANVNSKLAA